MKIKLVLVEIVLLIVAFLDATYLTFHHYAVNIMQSTEKSFCSINSFVDCDSVARSDYSLFLGLPISTIGIFAYSFIFLFYFITKKDLQEKRYSILGLISLSMLLFSLYEFFASVFVLHSVCLMCCLLYISIIGLFIIFKVQAKKTWKEILGENIHFFSSKLWRISLFIKTTIIFIFSIVLAFYSDRSFANYFVKKKEKVEQERSENLRDQVLKSYFSLKKVELDNSTAPIWGDKASTLTIVEFSDFQCPACSQRSTFLKGLKKKYDGKLKISFKHYPLDQACNDTIKRPFHPFACRAARASVCAYEQGKFWELHDLLFEYQHELAERRIFDFVKKLNLNEKDFKNCLESKSLNFVLANLAEAKKLDINYTPSIYLEGRRISDIAKSAEDYFVVIEHLLGSTKKL